MTAVEFSFPAPTTRLSLNSRVHWAVRAQKTRLWRQAAAMYALQARPRGSGYLPPSNVHITFEVGDPGKRRDPSNFMLPVKACVDGITDSGYWPDDDWKHVTVIEPSFTKARKVNGKTDLRVVVSITPRQEAA